MGLMEELAKEAAGEVVKESVEKNKGCKILFCLGMVLMGAFLTVSGDSGALIFGPLLIIMGILIACIN